MRVSVVIAAYDTEKYLKRCVDSVLSQTLHDIEIILVNDASTDNTAEIMADYAKEHENITYINLPRGGVSRARNAGFAAAGGEYVLFADSDDYMEETMLEKMYLSARANDCDAVICNFLFEGEDTQSRVALKMPPEPFRTVENTSFATDTISQKIYLGFCVFNKLFSRKLIAESGVLFTDREEVFAEDAFFYCRVVSHLHRVAFVDVPLYHYCSRRGSAMNTYKPRLADRFAAFLKATQSYYDTPAVSRACRVLGFLFFLEILMNEIEYGAPYAALRDVWEHPFYKEYLKAVPLCALSPRRRVMYILYKMRMKRVMYAVLCHRTGKEIRF